jgi:hypothetical protein
MAIKAGNIVHVGNETVVIDRIQTAGPGNLNIPTEKIYELGNYQSVATIRDVPDLTFTMDSYDVSTEIEEMLTGGNPATGIDLATCVPIDIASQFKPGIAAASPYQVISSVALPFLYMESVSYRFGLRDNAQQSVSLRGDSIFYNPGATYVQTVAGTNAANQNVATAYAAYEYTGDGSTRRVLSVTVEGKRLTKGTDYTEAYGTVTNGAAISTITILEAVPTTSDIRIVYSSPQAKSYLQAVHEDATVKPAAVRGKDIEIYVGGYTSGDLWGSVQSVNVDWRVNLEKDEEFGNYYAVSQDFDVPEVNGSIDIKPKDPAELLTKIRQAAGETDQYAVLGAQSSTPLELNVLIKDPETGDPLKRLHVPDARFTVPGYSGRVQNKLTVTMNFESDAGTLIVYDN